MIKQRLDQGAGALLRKFCAKDSLGDCQTMSEINDNRDEIIRLQSRTDFRRSQEVSDKISSVANLLPMHFHKALPNTFVAKRSRLKFSAKHDPIMVSKQVGDGVPHLLQPLFARGFFIEKRSKNIQVARLLLCRECSQPLTSP